MNLITEATSLGLRVTLTESEIKNVVQNHLLELSARFLGTNDLLVQTVFKKIMQQRDFIEIVDFQKFAEKWNLSKNEKILFELFKSELKFSFYFGNGEIVKGKEICLAAALSNSYSACMKKITDVILNGDKENVSLFIPGHKLTILFNKYEASKQSKDLMYSLILPLLTQINNHENLTQLSYTIQNHLNLLIHDFKKENQFF